MENTQNNASDRELRLTRVLDAPVALVWEVWTQPEHIAKWWGPDGFTSTITKMELQAGGEWRQVIHGPDGTDYPNKSIFREIVHHKKIVYEHVSSPKFIVTVEFEENGGQTNISWHTLFETADEFIQMVKTLKAEEGLRQTIEKLNAYLVKEKSKN